MKLNTGLIDFVAVIFIVQNICIYIEVNKKVLSKCVKLPIVLSKKWNFRNESVWKYDLKFNENDWE